MALIDCPECGQQISEKAPTCPHCGVPIAHVGEIAVQPEDTEPEDTESEATVRATGDDQGSPEERQEDQEQQPVKLLTGLPQGVNVANPWIRLGSYLLEIILFWVTLGIGWLIWGVFTGPTGQTPAKRLLSLRVIRGDNLQPAALARMFWVRGLLAGIVAYFAIIFTLGILLFMPFWDRRNQNIWDKVSNCYVVSDPDDAWDTRPDLA